MLSLAIAAPPAAPPIIGTVTAGGAFRLNGDTVMTNGTLTEGALLETGRGRSSVRLAGGARLTLNADSRGKLYSNHIVLEKGETGLENGVGFHLEVLGLTIHPVRGLSTGRVGLLGNNRVRVAALTGSFRVLNARGVLVANVAAGTAVAFEPQATPAATRITGTLTRQNGHFLLTDQVTRVTVEVTGPRLAGYVGQTVGVTGAANVASSSYQSASLVIASGQVQAVPAGAARSANTTSIVGGVAAVPEVGFTASGAPPVQAQASPPGGVPPGPPVTPPGQPPGRPPVTPPGPPTTPPGRPPDRPPVSPPGLSR
jgi:hypothetical protein